MLAGGGENACVSTALTAASSAWECVDSRAWDGGAITVCVSSGSRMFWSVLRNKCLGRREAGAGTGEERWGQVEAGGRASPGLMGARAGSSQHEGQQAGSCCFSS